MSPSNQQSCCGVVEEARFQVHERRASKRQPWIVLKFAIGLTVGLNAYAAYVYVGIFCRNMILKNQNALGSQAMGIVFLVVFCILLLMVSWSYIMVVTTSPGYAIAFVEKIEGHGHQQSRAQLPSTHSDTPGMSYELLSPKADLSHSAPHGSDTQTRRDDQKDRLQASPTSGTTENVTSPSTSPAAPQDMFQSSPQHRSANTPEEAHVADVLANPETLHVQDLGVLPSWADSHKTNLNLPPPIFSRQPSTRPILLPEYRYCSKDKIVKPPRAHHCRACGTCVLKYDHHCPWIGHCVGAFNQKFFVNFVQWAAILAFWMFATLLGLTVKSRTKSPALDINPQEIVVIVLTALFGTFCGLMFMTQVHLIMLNQTTVESLAFRGMIEREQATLAHMHNWYEMRCVIDLCLSHSNHDFYYFASSYALNSNVPSAKRRTRRNWDAEWGRIGKEGNLWWLGSSRENWESVMGKNVWWWFLPVGHGLQDGLSFPTNPRFDKQGRWRRRREWPSELR